MTPECYGELKQGKRDRGALKKPFKNQLKHQLSLTENDHSGWEKLAEDRDEWRALIKRATWHFEAIRKQVADDKRQKRKHVASLPPPPPDQAFVCPRCSRLCRSYRGTVTDERVNAAKESDSPL